MPYPLVPSKKDKERHLARFLDIFRKLEITIPFGEALQQMPLYSKFLKDMLTRKHKYIHRENKILWVAWEHVPMGRDEGGLGYKI